MSVDWADIARQVDGALKSVGVTDEGFRLTLRQAAAEAGADPWEPSADAPTYTTFVCIQDEKQVRDLGGTLIAQTVRTLTVNAMAGVVPTKADAVALGIAADEANEESLWEEIVEVRALAPAGVAVLYEIDLVV
ncbi:MAG: hypothetical protein AAF449_03935 [Myxococcota bacterium]